MPNPIEHLIHGISGSASGNVVGKTTSANAELVAAPPTGQYWYMTDLVIINHDASAASTVSLKSGSTTILSLQLDSGQGVSHAFTKPVKFTNAATAVNVGLGGAASSPGVDVFVNGFYSKEAN